MCNGIQLRCHELDLDFAHKQILSDAVASLKESSGKALYAIRSSSPEEDLEDLSFAGGYETTLGVTLTDIENAVRRSFTSCFDDRVTLYKLEHGLAVDKPRIAVIVQQMIESESAGVAFSLNPLNNCYDEVVINANFGLGESVVSGKVSPDTIIVDKVSRVILDKRIGKKETSVWLEHDHDGGTYLAPAPTHQRLSLSDEQILALLDMVVRVEKHYQKPVDIEWAFAADDSDHNELWLLQARPITTYVPLPGSLVTRPGEFKRLYLDASFKEGLTEPMSVLATDYWTRFESKMTERMTGRDLSDVASGLAGYAEGRMYYNASNYIKLLGKKSLVNFYRTIDVPTAEIIAHLDETQYLSAKLPPVLKGIKLSMVKNSIDTGTFAIWALLHPSSYSQRLEKEADRFQRNLEEVARLNTTIDDLAQEIITCTNAFLEISMPSLLISETARSRIKKIFKHAEPEIRNRIVYLEQALPKNITIEMGFAMHHLAQYEEIQTCKSGIEFTHRIENRTFSHQFLAAWDSFMHKYGFRCPLEFDIATPRYHERPAWLFEQLRTMAENNKTSTCGIESHPRVIFDRARAKREKAHQVLSRAARNSGFLTQQLFELFYRALINLGGYRELHKYYCIMGLDLLRKRVLKVAQSLVESGRLDHENQVFDLTLNDLETGTKNTEIDLRSRASKNTRFRKTISRVREFPRVIDSRGRIYHPPILRASKGPLVGEPISPGLAKGKVIVLHQPDEKPVLPGDILVARATDPGWTILFINAGGIVLETGGLLQHGALVAREYGKPCVAGVEDAMSKLKDGQVIEVDGTSGIIRLISNS
jgi:pyruvate,water dikinase